MEGLLRLLLALTLVLSARIAAGQARSFTRVNSVAGTGHAFQQGT
jgi:hypothetical protein